MQDFIGSGGGGHGVEKLPAPSGPNVIISLGGLKYVCIHSNYVFLRTLLCKRHFRAVWDKIDRGNSGPSLWN